MVSEINPSEARSAPLLPTEARSAPLLPTEARSAPLFPAEAWSAPLISALLLGALALGGCERLNPSWCDKLGRCAAGQICNPVNNTCESHDATPDILSHLDYPVADAPRDDAQELGPAQEMSIDAVDLAAPIEVGASVDSGGY